MFWGSREDGNKCRGTPAGIRKMYKGLQWLSSLFDFYCAPQAVKQQTVNLPVTLIKFMRTFFAIQRSY